MDTTDEIKRWAKFSPEDAHIGVLHSDTVFANGSTCVYVPHVHKDRMNAVAFYISMYGKQVELEDSIITETNGFVMSRTTYTLLRELVHAKTGPSPEPVYATS